MGVQLFAASLLALLQPDNTLLVDYRNLWLVIAKYAFENGAYDPDSEAQTHHDLTGVTVKKSYLTLDNRYTLELLGAHADLIPNDLEAKLLD